MFFLSRNLNTRARAICFTRQHRELSEEPIDSGLAQQIIRVFQQQVLGNFSAPSQPCPALRLRQCCRPCFIKFAHIRLPHGIMSAESSPTIPNAEPIFMTRSYRALKRLLTVIPAVGLFLLISANPFAQSNKLPAPASHVSDFAGVIDSQTKSRLENLLQKLKEKSNIELYVATVDSTGTQEVSAFSQQLARDWNIGTKSAR